MQTDIAIIGGGLSGLALARHLAREGRDFQLFEARSRFGGRIDSLLHGAAAFDLGPAWFWPGQHRIAALAEALGLERFDQYATGAVCYESETGEVFRDMGFASMQGSWRLKRGMGGLIRGLTEHLPSERLHLDHEVRAVTQQGEVRFRSAQSWQARQIILALPPRLAAEISFTPALSREQLKALQSIPTWMGGHAKFVALYEDPFWREAGLSGDAMSRSGPLAEIHDASAPGAHSGQGPEPASPAALFGFVATSAAVRQRQSQGQGQQAQLTREALAQLSRIFGPQAAHPIKTVVQDWAQDRHTATPRDLIPPRQHPAYGLPAPLHSIWDGRLSLCVSEVAPEMGGYLEGALAAAEQTAADMKKELI
jgi:monoamine oxidase